MLIFLIGMMGSGKTTIGNLLAESLQLPFFDTDDIISSMEEQSIPDIFDKHGEAYFRNEESNLIKNWKISNGIVATGGGLPCYNDMISILNEKGITIFLDIPADILTMRLSGCDERPLVSGKTDKEINKIIKDLLKIRKPFYRQARYRVINAENPSIMAKKIISKIYS